METPYPRQSRKNDQPGKHPVQETGLFLPSLFVKDLLGLIFTIYMFLIVPPLHKSLPYCHGCPHALI